MPELLWNTQTLAVVATFGALATALVNYHQGRIAARAHKAQLYLEFSARYNAPEIAVALQALVDWKRKYGEAFAETFRAKFEARDPEAIQINFHRRTANAYFVDVATAYRAGVVSRYFARLAIDHPGAGATLPIPCPSRSMRTPSRTGCRSCCRSTATLARAACSERSRSSHPPPQASQPRMIAL